MSYVDDALKQAKALLSNEEDFSEESNQNNMLILGIVIVLFILVLLWFFGTSMYYGSGYVLYPIYSLISQFVSAIASLVGF